MIIEGMSILDRDSGPFVVYETRRVNGNLREMPPARNLKAEQVRCYVDHLLAHGEGKVYRVSVGIDVCG